ncbi:hypothetical protein [Lacinutrix sp. Hel_I_90]|uniref:hypothetical protein n=1 Tax=Lacinutrix sp. Hel_I_90 TaxID=1249999 RepID=UPI0005C82340|nr:hypothetical protein [Lacinutrix sp. Hel_I_90]
MFGCSSTSDDSKDTVQEVAVPISNTEILNQYEAWQSADLKTLFSNAEQKMYSYTFDKEVLQQLINNEETAFFRFFLGVQNNTLEIYCSGLTKERQTVDALQKGEQQVCSFNLKEETNSKSAFDITSVKSAAVRKHILDKSAATDYLKNWEVAINDSATLEDKVSYDGTRIKHFTIGQEAIAYLINNDNVASVALVLGLNKENKMTTVFYGKNRAGALLSSKTDDSPVLDFTAPCPTTCD